MFVIGTRGSALALWQANAVKSALSAAFPQEEFEIRAVTTTGDRVLDKPLEQIGDKGLFTKELESALLAGDVDICVHSMKDVPSELVDGCCIAAMLARADVRDVLVCGPRIQAQSLAQVPAGARLGTGSLRRSAQLRALHPHIEPKPIRGNVDTRLAKAQGNEYEGVVLAAAGVERMNAADAVSAYIPVEEMLPAAGQGAIGIEVRVGDERVARMLACIDDAATSLCVNAERRVLAKLEGGCQVPLGVYARLEDDVLVIDAAVFSLDGARQVRTHVVDSNRDAEAAADSAVRNIIADGGLDILDEVRERGGAS